MCSLCLPILVSISLTCRNIYTGRQDVVTVDWFLITRYSLFLMDCNVLTISDNVITVPYNLKKGKTFFLTRSHHIILFQHMYSLLEAYDSNVCTLILLIWCKLETMWFRAKDLKITQMCVFINSNNEITEII